MINLVRKLPRFRKAYRELDTLAARETWSRAEIEAWQLERLNRLWRHACSHVPYYRDLCGKFDLPPRFDSIHAFQQQVPLLPKATLRSNREQFLSECHQPGRWGLTGGSTGVPTTTFRSHEAQLAMLRSRYRFYQMWDVDIFDRWVFVWGHLGSFIHGWSGWVDRWKTPLLDRLRNRRRLSAYNVGPEDIQNHLRKIVAFRPAAIYSYSSAGYLLALEAARQGIHCPSLKMVNLSAEPAFPHIVKAVEEAFGVPAVVEYGSMECGYVAGEWPDRTLRVREDDILLETLPRDDGRWDIVITVLGNPSFPLLRYRIEDITDAPLERPQRGFAYLHNVAGRNNDLVITRAGRRLNALWFEDVLAVYPVFRRWHVHQKIDGAITVSIEAVEPVADRILAKIKSRLEAVIDGYPVSIQLVEKVPSTPAGKHRCVVSDLAQSQLPSDRATTGVLSRAAEHVDVGTVNSDNVNELSGDRR